MKPVSTRQIIFNVLLVAVFAVAGWKVYADQTTTVKYKVQTVRFPKYFDPVQWNPNGWVMGTMSDKFLQFNPENGAWKVLYSGVWSGVTDQQGKVLAFRNEKGIQYVDLAHGGGTILIDTHPEASIHFWSPTGRYLLYSHMGEWAAEYFIFDRDRLVSTPFVFQNVENFMSTPLAWKNINGQEQLVFMLRFSKSRTGEGAYRSTGYRSELYLANLNAYFTPIVQVPDGDFINYDGISPDNKRLYYHYYDKKDQIWEKNLLTGKSTLRWTLKYGNVLSISFDNNIGLLERSSLQLINLKRNEIVHSFSFEYSEVVWSADQSKALILPSLKSKIMTGYLVTVQ